ncbi:MAG: VWA domain-containing protein [Gammaproteobacteria bacterium]|nr:VWA domain-containing protein [Gammaproteobacteria bacterium]
MIHLEWPWVLLALPLPWLVMHGLPPAPSAGESALRVPFMEEVLALHTAATQRKTRQRRWSLAALWLAWLLLTLAAARPQWLGEPVNLPMSGRDLLLAVDLSGSMAQEDFILNGHPANRLQVVKAAARNFIEQRVGDRLGLILFGAQAYLQTPLTFDRNAVATLLNEAVVGLAGKETAIGDAIGLALKRLRDSAVQDRVLILLTDGANTAGEVAPRQAAKLAAEQGMRIYTIGLGAKPMRRDTFLGPQIINPSADLDEATLQTVAELTGGRYFRATDLASLEAIYQELDQLEPVTKDTEYFRPRQSLFVWPLSFALLISVLFAVHRLSWPMIIRAKGSRTARALE